jgi:DNA-directed RNA polymerase subunit RPC12/RpoP
MNNTITPEGKIQAAKNRTRLFWIGLGIIVFGIILSAITKQSAFQVFFSIIGWLFWLICCFYWAMSKNQSSWHTLWAIFAPIGFIILFALDDRPIEDKSKNIEKEVKQAGFAINYCPNCGYKLDKVVNFCPNCGFKIDAIKVN